LPNGWKNKLLGEIGEFSKGKNISLADTVPTGLPATMYGDIYVKYDTSFKSVDYRISQETASKSTPIKNGTLLFTGSGETAIEIGKCAVYLGNEIIYIGGDIIAFSPEKDDALFLAYQQNSYYQIKQKARFGQGNSVVHIYKDHLSSLKIPLPPLDEQRKIAEILRTWDEAITLTERLIATLEQRKKGLMQRLLTGQLRFPGFTDPWREVKLGEIAKVIMGQSPESVYYNMESIGLPLIQGNADIKDRKTSPKNFTSQITKECQIGDIILSVRAPVGETAISTIGRGVCAIRADNCDQEYLYYSLLNFEYKWNTFAQGSTFTAINSTDIRNLSINTPSLLKEQKKISNVLSECDQGINNYSKKLKRLIQQKQGLMQRLLNGQVRVNV
jgi:type I restriction enzyme S subunit